MQVNQVCIGNVILVPGGSLPKDGVQVCIGNVILVPGGSLPKDGVQVCMQLKISNPYP